MLPHFIPVKLSSFFLPSSSLTSETMYNTKYFLKTQWSETEHVAQKLILDSASLKPTIYGEKINVPKVNISSIKLASSPTKYKMVKTKLKMCSVVKSCASNSYPPILIAFLALFWQCAFGKGCLKSAGPFLC